MCEGRCPKLSLPFDWHRFGKTKAQESFAVVPLTGEKHLLFCGWCKQGRRAVDWKWGRGYFRNKIAATTINEESNLPSYLPGR